MGAFEDYGVVEPDVARRLAFAANLAVCVHRALGGGVHNPCGAFYSVDGPDGWNAPMKLCACNYPMFELRRAA